MSSGTAVAQQSPYIVCINCGVQAPTRQVTLYQNIGMVIARQTVKIEGELCRRCINGYFKSFTLTTLFLGWWGVISFIITPLILINNVVRYLQSMGLSEPDPGVIASSPMAGERVKVGAGSPTFKLVYGAVVVIVLLGVLAYNNVSFVEKHAPRLNETLHGGEISESADAEYAVRKIAKDVEALDASSNAKDWAALRAEFHNREPYLADLKDQNGKIQRVLSEEKGTTDACEQINIQQFGPAMNDYTTGVDRLYTIVRNTEKATDEVRAQMDAAGTQVDQALQRLSAYSKTYDARGCGK